MTMVFRRPRSVNNEEGTSRQACTVGVSWITVGYADDVGVCVSEGHRCVE